MTALIVGSGSGLCQAGLSVLLLDKVGMPVVVLRQVPGLMGQNTVEPPQFQFIVGRRHPLRSAEAVPLGPDCSADHRNSSVAIRFYVVDDPVVLVVRKFLRQFMEIFTFFYVKTWISDPEVDSRLSGVSASTGLWTLLGDDFRYVSVSPRFDSGYIFGVSLRVLLKEFHIFYVKDDPEVDSRPGAVRTQKSGHYSYERLYDV